MNKLKRNFENDSLFITKLPKKTNISINIERNNSFPVNSLLSKFMSKSMNERQKQFDSNTEKTSTIDSKGFKGLNVTCTSNGNNEMGINQTNSVLSYHSVHSVWYKDKNNFVNSRFACRKRLIKHLIKSNQNN